MKKLILTGVLIFGSFLTMQAQANFDDVEWGVRGGATFSTVTGDDFDSPDSRTGFYAGLLAEVPFSERFSIQPELYYSEQGFKIADNEYGKAKYRLNYAQLPVLLKAYLIKGLNIQAGPQLGLKVHEDIDYDTDLGSGDYTMEDSGVRDIDFGVVAGLEYKFEMGLFVQARYNYGLTKISDKSGAHNSVFQIGAGLMF